MRKKTKNGFTLIELLAVVVILLAISVIAVASINAAIERNKEKQNKTKISVILSYAELYYDENKIAEDDGCIELGKLELSASEREDAYGNSFQGVIKHNNGTDFRFDSTTVLCPEHSQSEVKSNGYITLSSSTGDMIYGDRNTLTFTVLEHHGGVLSVIDDSDILISAISNKTVTISNLSTVPVGNVIITVISAETSDYTEASAQYKLTINATSNQQPTPSEKNENPTTITANALTYNGAAQELVSVSNKQGTVYYSTTKELNSNNYTSGSTTIPTKTDAGTYTVYYYVNGGTNYKSKSGNVSVTIRQATNPTTIASKSLTYNGTAQELVSVSNKQGTVYYSTTKELNSSNYTSGSTTIPTKINAGTYTVYYYVNGNTNYKSKSGSVSVTIRQATNPTTIASKSLTYNGTAQELVSVSNKQGTVYYSTTKELNSSNYTSGSTTIPTKTDVGTYTVYYYVNGGTNYKSKSGNVSVTITKAPVCVSYKCPSDYKIIGTSDCCPIVYGVLGDKREVGEVFGINGVCYWETDVTLDACVFEVTKIQQGSQAESVGYSFHSFVRDISNDMCVTRGWRYKQNATAAICSKWE